MPKKIKPLKAWAIVWGGEIQALRDRRPEVFGTRDQALEKKISKFDKVIPVLITPIIKPAKRALT